MELKRYDFEGGTVVKLWHERPQGRWVLTADAQAALAEKDKEIERLRDADEAYKGSLWCALGHPLNISYIEAVKQMRQQLAAQDAEHIRTLDELSELRGDVQRLAEENAQLKVPVSELADVCVKIREMNSAIILHPCQEKSKPDHAAGDPGSPPCGWADIDEDDYCDNCKITSQARKDRRKFKMRRWAIVRKLAARAQGGSDAESQTTKGGIL